MATYVTLEANSEEELDLKIYGYMTRYHPLGYDTRVDRKRYNEDTKKYEADISRLSSCD
jgi:hypothetical protein